MPIAMSMIMVITVCFSIRIKRSRDQRFNSRISVSASSGIQLNAGFLYRIDRACADTAADKGINIIDIQNSGQCSAAFTIGIQYLGIYSFPILDIIDFEPLRLSKMSEYISVVISYSHSHCSFSFLCKAYMKPDSFPVNLNVPAGNVKSPALNHSLIVFTIFIFLRAHCLIMKEMCESYHGTLQYRVLGSDRRKIWILLRIGRQDGNYLWK